MNKKLTIFILLSNVLANADVKIANKTSVEFIAVVDSEYKKKVEGRDVLKDEPRAYRLNINSEFVLACISLRNVHVYRDLGFMEANSMVYRFKDKKNHTVELREKDNMISLYVDGVCCSSTSKL